MIRVFRVTKEKYKNDLSGFGAAQTGGRWNRKGLHALYTASNSSLAILEVLAHCDRLTDMMGRIIQELEIPADGIVELRASELEDGWQSIPWGTRTVEQGSRWLEGFSSLTLKVPSAVNPKESNYIINPRHPQIHMLKLVSEEELPMDSRILHIMKG